MPHPYLEGVARPRVFAHRGLLAQGRGEAENTRGAFERAIAAGVDYLESDCHLTADGAVVLFHDAQLQRVTGDPRSVAQVTRAELAELMADRGGLMTLDELLEEFPRIRLNLDVKAEAAAEPMGRIVAPHAERVLLTSFSDRYRVRALRAAADAARSPLLPATSPGRSALARILLAVASRSARLAARQLAGFDALQIPERYGSLRVLSPRLIEAAHAAGVEVHLWTVNDPERMRRLAAAGVDGIITDRADLALAVLGE